MTVEESLKQVAQRVQSLRDTLAETIVGQTAVVDEVLWALVAGGHVLLEGNPGLGKTLLVRCLSAALRLHFSRIQFTPDLMPSDVTGTHVLLLDDRGHSTGRFELQRGPIFGQLVLADEINRATPKTQSALLEAMQERAVTLGGQRYPLDAPFFVLATENPIEMEGTYPLPEAQLDRFLVNVIVASPGEDDLVEILRRTTGREHPLPPAILDRAEVLELQTLCRAIPVAEPVLRYAARLVAASDPHGLAAPQAVRRNLRLGAGVRAGQALVLAGKACALLEGRAQLAFDDVRRVAHPVLRHRLLRSFEGEAEGISTDSIIDALLESVPLRPAPVQRALDES